MMHRPHVVIPDDQQDKQLPDKLAAELPGILAWCVRGCLAWQEIGEPAPTGKPLTFWLRPLPRR